MSMLIPGQNQLAEPAIIAVDAFEPLLSAIQGVRHRLRRRPRATKCRQTQGQPR